MSALYTCKHCGGENIYLEQRGNNKGVFCTDCDSWIAWVGKKVLGSKELKQQIDASSAANLERTKRLKGETAAAAVTPATVQPVKAVKAEKSTDSMPAKNDTPEPMYVKLTDNGLTLFSKGSRVVVPPEGFIKTAPYGVAVYDRYNCLVAKFNYT
jgi:DNA-directed RNA polymerase subunit RPC12/RpoP